MTWLAPWMLALGALGALGVIAAHLLARHRPPRAPLPTARFVPTARPVSSTRLARPSDLALLALRVVAVLAIAAAFARPVLLPSRGSVARVVLLDRSGAVASPAAAADSARANLRAGDLLVTFDSAPQPPRVARDADVALGDTARREIAGSLSAGLAAALRAGASLRAQADSVELVVVSPLARREVDAATRHIRGAWPGRLRIVRVAERATPADSGGVGIESAPDDPVRASIALAGMQAAVGGATAARISRATPLADDSAFVHGGRGRVLVVWPAAGTPAHPFASRDRADTSGAVIARGAVVVAPFVRNHLPPAGRVVARWADGEPAATESALGSGCVRHVALDLPGGDVALRPSMQAFVRALLGPCAIAGEDAIATRPDSAGAWSLHAEGPAQLASSRALARLDVAGTARSPLVPWLLGTGVLLLLAEMLLRDRRRPAAEGA